MDRKSHRDQAPETGKERDIQRYRKQGHTYTPQQEHTHRMRDTAGEVQKP